MDNSRRPNRSEPTFQRHQMQEIIKNALDSMGEEGFDFQYSTKESLVNLKCKQMLRKVYLRFQCKQCQAIASKKQRRWTSVCGTFGIKFVLKPIKGDRRDPFLFIFQPRIYGMMCLKCEQYGQAQIYDSQLQAMEKQFVRIIAQILNKDQPKVNTRNQRPIKVPKLINHKTELCQACSLGKCQGMGGLIE